MSSHLITKLRAANVIPLGFHWKFYTESTGEFLLSLNPATYSDTNGTIGLLRTPTGSLFVKFTSPYELANLCAESITELMDTLNGILVTIDCKIEVVGSDIRLVRRKTGVYTLAIDKLPLTSITIGTTLLALGESKLKRYYTVKPYINIPTMDMYGLVEAVNGLRGIHLGTPVGDLISC